MPSLSSDNSLAIQISTSADSSGIDQTQKGLESIGKTTTETQKTTSDFSEKFSSGMKKTAIGLGVLGVGMTAYAKNATDFTVDLVKSSKTLARETGTTVENASQLVYVTQRMGLSADQASSVFGIFSKKITEVADATGKNSIQQSKLQQEIKNTEDQLANAGNNAKQRQAELKNQIDATNISINENVKKIAANGDASGALKNKVEALRLKLVDLQQQYNDTGESSGSMSKETLALNTKLADLKQQLSASTDSFQKLGINVKDAQGKTKSFNDLLLEVSDKFKELKNGSEKTAIAMDLFGRSGKDMLPLLNQGSQAIQDMEKKADQLGLTLTAQTVGSISAYIRSQKDLTDSTNALKMAVGEATAPVLTAFNNKVNDVLLSLLSTDSPMRGLTANVLAFGGPALSFTATALGIASSLVQIIGGAGGARAAIASLQLTAAAGVILPVAGALASAAALAGAIYEVNKAINKVSAGIDDLNKKQITLSNSNIKVSGGSGVGLVQQLRNAFGGFAAGTNSAPGGVSVVGEEGPELVNLPRGAQVFPAHETKSLLAGARGGSTNGGNRTVSIQNVYLGSADASREFFNQLDSDTLLTSKGLTPNRGMI